MEEKVKKIVVEVCRILLGFLFVFSGFVKAIDPLGSAYKFQDYFTAFGFDWMKIFSLPLSFALSSLEFTLGVCILLAVYRRFTTILCLLFMSFMTLLTFYSAIANPVSDCGCFGDAWVISNWQTFYKNLVLLAAAIVLFLWYKKMKTIYYYQMNWFVMLYTFLFILSVSFYCYRNLPVLDFRPYKIGTHIPDKMVIPEGMPADKDITTFIYKKDGVKKEFTLEEAPMHDSSWEFVDAKNIVIKGYQPPIHDFIITTSDGLDITEDILIDTNYTFLMISPKLENAEESNVDRLNEIYDYTLLHGYKFYCLCASSPEVITEWIDNTGAEYPICTTDETTLKTIIRSNPGLMLLKDGTVYNKWANNNIPEAKALDEPLVESPLGKIKPDKGMRNVFLLALLFCTPLALLLIDARNRYSFTRKKEQKAEESGTV